MIKHTFFELRINQNTESVRHPLRISRKEIIDIHNLSLDKLNITTSKYIYHIIAHYTTSLHYGAHFSHCYEQSRNNNIQSNLIAERCSIG